MMKRKKDIMSNKEENGKFPWGAIIITSIICLTIAVIGIFAITTGYESLRLTTGEGSVAESPLNAILQAQTGIMVGFVIAVISAGFGGVKLYSKLKSLGEKVTHVEQQTNGRTHHRDAVIDYLVTMMSEGSNKDNLKNANTVLNTERLNSKAPEDDYCDEEKILQEELFAIMDKMKQFKDKEKNK